MSFHADDGERPCTICGRPAVAFTLVPISEGGGRIMLCAEHEREADRRFRAMLREMAGEGAE